MSDEPVEHDSSTAIELSRRKNAPVRTSRAKGGRVTAPYVTMTRIALGRLTTSRLARWGALLLAGIGMIAIFADVLADDLPLACRWRGEIYLLPNITHPAALANLDCQDMARIRAAGDWLVTPLVAFGPAQTGAPEEVLNPPLTGAHPLGTDAHGRDVFARLVHGARTAASVSLAATAVLVGIGVVLGALAGFAGGLVDALIARIIESLTAIPTLVLVLVAGALVPQATTATLVWTIALSRWTELARLVRAEVLLSLGQDYVTAARALGAAPVRVLWRHVLPNAIAPAIVSGAFGIASVVLVEASVDFLRAGSPDARASWGEIMGEARTHASAWWLIAFPGIALIATLIGSMLVGEAARDALDPRTRGGESPDELPRLPA